MLAVAHRAMGVAWQQQNKSSSSEVGRVLEAADQSPMHSMHLSQTPDMARLRHGLCQWGAHVIACVAALPLSVALARRKWAQEMLAMQGVSAG